MRNQEVQVGFTADLDEILVLLGLTVGKDFVGFIDEFNFKELSLFAHDLAGIQNGETDGREFESLSLIIYDQLLLQVLIYLVLLGVSNKVFYQLIFILNV